jgi:anti-sigma B factor antagonist
MEVTAKRVGKAIIIYVDGDMTTHSSPLVEAEINEFLAGETTHVIINAAKVNFIASTGLRIIRVLGKKLDHDGCKLCMCSMNETTKSVFNLTGFSKIFPVFETEDDALGSL